MMVVPGEAVRTGLDPRSAPHVALDVLGLVAGIGEVELPSRQVRGCAHVLKVARETRRVASP